jgi:hypothetical protein
VTEGRIRDLEVWGVGPEPQPEQGRGTSVLDMDPEVQVRFRSTIMNSKYRYSNIPYEIES